MKHLNTEEAEALYQQIGKSDPVLAETLRHVLPTLQTEEDAYAFGYKNLSLRQNGTILQALSAVAPELASELADNLGRSA
jgi:hypothetical protein